jgi:hypothetical protein
MNAVKPPTAKTKIKATVVMQRVPAAWTDCSWTPKVSRAARVGSARPLLIRALESIPQKNRRSGVQVESP